MDDVYEIGSYGKNTIWENMTIEEFNKTSFGAHMFVMYHGKRRAIGSVNFQESLIGLVSEYEP